MTSGTMLRVFRESHPQNGRPISQARLGELLGPPGQPIPANTVARWERGVVDVQHPEILALALCELHRRLDAVRATV